MNYTINKYLYPTLLTYLTILPIAAQKTNVVSVLEIFNIETNKRSIVMTEDAHFEAPNWSKNGKFLVINQNGGLFKTSLTYDTYSNWFAHPSPDGKYFVFISYLEQQGSEHPAMKEVALRLYTIKDKTIKTLCELTGGQGTLNVPSWSPDGKRFAFVSYSYQ